MKPVFVTIFIAIFAAVYGALHYYAYRKFAPLFPQHPWLLITILVLLGCSIFVVEIFMHANVVNGLARSAALLSFSWMGILFLFFALSGAIDVITWVAGKTAPNQLQIILSAPSRTIVVSIVVLLVAGYGHWSSHRFRIEKISLASPKITTPLTVVQITDLHLGVLGDEAYFREVVDAVNAVDPDIIVSTGDLVDMQIDHLPAFQSIMSGLRARLGKYAVYGNHEALAGVDASRAFTEKVGFTLLSDSGITIDKAINLVGVDDPAIERWRQTTPVDEAALLKQFDNGLFTILLKHQPRIDHTSQGLFDLQLSGHTHGGQIFPFGLLIHLFYKEPFGFSHIGGNSRLYVSRGTGTWGPPMRVLAPPEITLIQLCNDDQPS